MQKAEQEAGEKKVETLLIDPLMRRGLSRPSNLTKAAFEAMVKELRAKLAYMSEVNLRALEEQVAAHPAGKDADRLPIANIILGWAGKIEPPGDGASALMIAVLQSQLGIDAVAGDWAAELRGQVRRARRWPEAHVVERVKEKARDNRARVASIKERQERGVAVPDADLAFVEGRAKASRACAALSKQSAS